MPDPKKSADPFGFSTPKPTNKKNTAAVPPQPAPPRLPEPTQAPLTSPWQNVNPAGPTLPAKPPGKPAANFVFSETPPRHAAAAKEGPAPAGDAQSYTHLPTQDLSAEKLLMPASRKVFRDGKVPALGGVPLMAKLGQGGMGAVYLGWLEAENRPVAVKVLPFQMAEQDPQMIQRFVREATLTARIKSPNLVSVQEAREENGLFFIVMEYINGESAGGFQKKHKRGGVSEADALDICIAATQGLVAAHQEGIIHRDIKPDNILLPMDVSSGKLMLGRGKLADLGLARTEEHGQSLTASQTAMGTPGYLAPEQAVDARKCGKPADIFSMGATLYALLTGRAPFQAPSPMEAIMKTMKDPHEPLATLRPDASPASCALVDRCLAKEPRHRFKDAEALLRALKLVRTVLDKPDEQTHAVEAIRRQEAEPEASKKSGEPVYFDEMTYQAAAKPKRAEVLEIEAQHALRAQGSGQAGTRKLIAALVLAGFMGAGIAMLAMGPGKPAASAEERAKAEQEARVLLEAQQRPAPAPAPAVTPAPASHPGPLTKAEEAAQAQADYQNKMLGMMDKVDRQMGKAKVVEPIMPISSIGEAYEDDGHFSTGRIMYGFISSVLGAAYMLYSRKSKSLSFGLCGALLTFTSWFVPGLGWAVMLGGVCLAIPLFTAKS
ncbi:MAG: hypothetical protein AMXMBFR7_24930 [Planctomycetota bacterium]